jgi:glycosyltransferase involved in cell wall biosynthesis
LALAPSREGRVKVKDVIKDTVWRPGSLYDTPQVPSVSVLLPTYRRARNGLFRRAVESILAQTLQSLELIIIDDASTDGTAQQIRDFMHLDGRVSCLTHPRNIGLPAISEYEGFQKARGGYLAFAFDDDLFYPDALSKLLEYARTNPGNLCYGHVVMRIVEKWSTLEQSANLGSDLSAHNIRSWNCISNNAVLMPRHMIEDVGLFDPHVVLSRICDWDLWRRVSEKYLMKYVGVPVGEVTGPATKDSLGKTYALDNWAAEEWMRTRRNRNLQPQHYGDCELFEAESGHSRNTQLTCLDLSQSHMQTRPWLAIPQPVDHPDGQILVASLTNDASTMIHFEYLPEKIRSRIRILQYRGETNAVELGRASCLIIVRHLDPFEYLIDSASVLGIPCYYFLDDNFTLLQSSNKNFLEEDHRRYSLKTKLQNFAGVLLSTPGLRDFFSKHMIHPNLTLFPPCFAGLEPSVAPPPPPGHEGILTIAFMGGKHRHGNLKEAVLPAIAALSKTNPIHFIAGGADGDLSREMEQFENPNLRITCEPFEVDWKRSLMKFLQYRPHLLIHPAGDSVNNEFKTLNITASAWLLNAILLAPADPPYDILRQKGNAILVRDPFRRKSWISALEELLQNTAKWDEIRKRNSEFCKREFAGTANEEALVEMIKSAPPVGITTIESRLKELYKMRESTLGTGLNMPAISTQELRINLGELARIRRQRRHSKLVRLFAAPNDLWPDIAPAFEDIKRHMEERGFRGAGCVLELSDSLHDQDFIEFPLDLQAGILKTISSVFSTDGIQKGKVGLELLDWQGNALFNATRELTEVDLHGPVEFDMHELRIEKPALFRVRLFARSPWPVYTFEMIRYSRGRMSRQLIAPFMKLRFEY